MSGPPTSNTSSSATLPNSSPGGESEISSSIDPVLLALDRVRVSLPPLAPFILEQSTSVRPLIKNPLVHLDIVSYHTDDIRPLLKIPEGPSCDGTTRLRAWLRDCEYPAIVCIQDLKLNRDLGPLGKQLADEMLEAANMKGTGVPHYDASFSVQGGTHMDIPMKRKYGPFLGGCVTLVRNDLASRFNVYFLRQPDWDVEGRVVVVEIKEKSDSLKWSFVIINVLFPDGDLKMREQVFDTASLDADARLKLLPPSKDPAGLTHRSYKWLLQQRVLALVKGYESDGYEVLMIGDMNVVLDDPADHSVAAKTSEPGSTAGPERSEFYQAFLDPSQENGMRGIDTFHWLRSNGEHGQRHTKVSLVDDPQGHKERQVDKTRVDMSIVSRGIVEKEALNGSEILRDVFEDESWESRASHVQIKVVINLSNLRSK